MFYGAEQYGNIFLKFLKQGLCQKKLWHYTDIRLKAQEEIGKALPANLVTSEPVKPRHSISNYGNAAYLSFEILLIQFQKKSLTGL